MFGIIQLTQCNLRFTQGIQRGGHFLMLLAVKLFANREGFFQRRICFFVQTQTVVDATDGMQQRSACGRQGLQIVIHAACAGIQQFTRLEFIATAAGRI